MTNNITPQDALEKRPEPERKLRVPLSAYKAFESKTTPEFEAILDEVREPLKQLYASIAYRVKNISSKPFQ